MKLRALVNAIYLADRYDARIFYECRKREGWQKEFSSIDDEIYLFSREFIDKYSFSRNLHEVSILEHLSLHQPVMAVIELLGCQARAYHIQSR